MYRIGPASEVGGGEPAPSASPSGPAPSDAGEGATVTIGTDTGAALQFEPTEATAPGGGEITVVFENRSTVPHNLTFGPPIDAATATIVAAGASESISFSAPEPGDYEFVCTLHPGMDGVLTVE